MKVLGVAPTLFGVVLTSPRSPTLSNSTELAGFSFALAALWRINIRRRSAQSVPGFVIGVMRLSSLGWCD